MKIYWLALRDKEMQFEATWTPGHIVVHKLDRYAHWTVMVDQVFADDAAWTSADIVDHLYEALQEAQRKAAAKAVERNSHGD